MEKWSLYLRKQDRTNLDIFLRGEEEMGIALPKVLLYRNPRLSFDELDLWEL